MNLIPPDGSESGLITLGAGGLAALIWLRRFLSRQGVEVKKDTAEANLIKTLQEERDKAMHAAEKAWETRTNDAKLIGELSSEVRSLREMNERMGKQLEKVEGELHALRQELQDARKAAEAARSNDAAGA